MARQVALVALAPAALWGVLLTAFDLPFWSLVTDDSFYYLQIARHVADGHGSTFDGIHPTNGYHPLWLVVCVALFAVGLEGETAARAAVLLQVPLFVGAWAIVAAALGRWLRDGDSSRRTPLLPVTGVLLVAACAHPLVKVWVNGLEAALVLLLNALLLAVVLRTPQMLAPEARRARVAAGGLIALAFLARTDEAILLPVIALWALPALRREPRRVMVALFEWLLLPSLVVITYMAANQVIFGSAVQVSGLLKAAPPDGWRLIAAGALVAVPLWAVARLDAAVWPRLSRFLAVSGFFGLFGLVLIAYYAVLQVFPRIWYFGPPALYLLLLTAVALTDIAASVRADPDRRSGARTKRLLGLVYGLLGVGLVGWGLLQSLTAPAAAPLLANREAARYIARELPRNGVVASWDAGVVAYYSGRTVVNLDGVVNSAAYRISMLNGRTSEYLQSVPVGWVVNHHFDETALRNASIEFLGARANGMTLIAEWPFAVFAGMNHTAPTSHYMSVYLFRLP